MLGPLGALKCIPDKAHLHWQKPKSKKPGFFVVPFTLPEKPITFWVFGTKSACAKKPESHTCVLEVVRMRDFSLPLTVHV